MPRGDIIGQTIPFVGLIDEVSMYDRPHNHIEMVSLNDQAQAEPVIVERIKAVINFRDVTEAVLILIETERENGTARVEHEKDLMRAAVLLDSYDAPETFPESLALHAFVGITTPIHVFTTGPEAFSKFKASRE